jgi:hypothetical protein
MCIAIRTIKMVKNMKLSPSTSHSGRCPHKGYLNDDVWFCLPAAIQKYFSNSMYEWINEWMASINWMADLCQVLCEWLTYLISFANESHICERVRDHYKRKAGEKLPGSLNPLPIECMVYALLPPVGWRVLCTTRTFTHDLWCIKSVACILPYPTLLSQTSGTRCITKTGMPSP